MTIDRRDRALDQAEQRFAAQGFAGTSLSSIAAAAGLGNAGLLHHFPSKAALYRAVLEDIAAELDGRVAAAMGRAEDPPSQLQGLVDSLLGLQRDRPTALMIIAQEFLDRSGRIEAAGVLPLAGVVQVTVGVIEAGQQQGSIRQGDPLAMAAALHGALLHGALGEPVYARTAERRDDGPWLQEIARSALSGALALGPN